MIFFVWPCFSVNVALPFASNVTVSFALSVLNVPLTGVSPSFKVTVNLNSVLSDVSPSTVLETLKLPSCLFLI